MSWIGVTDLTSGEFNIRGIGVPKNTPGARPPAAPFEILPQGTLMIELRHDAEASETRRILTYRRNRDWPREIDVALAPNGRLSLRMRQGAARSHAALDLPPGLAHDSRLRISYSWHAPQRAGLLSVELLDAGRLLQAQVVDPVPLPTIDVRVLVRNGHATKISPGTCFVAISDAIEPVGIGGGIATGTPVETAEGPVPVERLRLGDMVVTAASGLQPVRWIGRRSVPALGSFRPIRIRAPYFGLGRDVTLAPDHRIRLGVAEAEYMLGEDEVLMPAAHLVNGKTARRDGQAPLISYHQVLLDVHDCLLHDGLWSESLFVGTIAQSPEVVKTTVLAEMPISAIPRHRSFSRHKLTAIEARSLAAAIRG